ncbi:hypothetical protein RvY_19276-3 [Ramazzottius varieornatus]|uniref:Uncharacterized protein n=1 Tax=Ramazzottius varieornatus TaxID=947166 RepID=A0A1D1W8V4_RAMVA|nr:hypothetical protein RvY_19276-3 [Ramazzottius varieornatus]
MPNLRGRRRKYFPRRLCTSCFPGTCSRNLLESVTPERFWETRNDDPISKSGQGSWKPRGFMDSLCDTVGLLQLGNLHPTSCRQDSCSGNTYPCLFLLQSEEHRAGNPTGQAVGRRRW